MWVFAMWRPDNSHLVVIFVSTASRKSSEGEMCETLMYFFFWNMLFNVEQCGRSRLWALLNYIQRNLRLQIACEL